VAKAGRFGRLLDFFLYTVIAVVVFGSLATFAVHQARTGGSATLPLKWLGFAGMTAIVFGYAIREHRTLWRSRHFWLVIASLFLAHSIVGIVVLLNIHVVPLLLFGPLTGLEFGAIAASLAFLFPRNRR